MTNPVSKHKKYLPEHQNLRFHLSLWRQQLQKSYFCISGFFTILDQITFLFYGSRFGEQ